MSRYAIDIETNGLLDELDRVHCMVIVDLDTGEVDSFRQEEVRSGLDMLSRASLIVAHNAIGFDIPALQKVYPEWCTSATIRDTLLLSRLQYPEVKHQDQKMFEKEKFPQKLIGRFSLKAWGHRLSCHKGEYEGGWEKWSPEMQEYCEQDTAVLVKLWNMLQRDPYAEAAVELEHRFAELAFRIEREGFPFNEEAAVKLYADLSSRQTVIEEELQGIFPPRVVNMKSHWWQLKAVYSDMFLGEGVKGKLYDSKKEGVEDGYNASDLERGPLKTKTIPFNPGSRDQIAARFIEKYNWKPTKFTPAGKPAVDEEVVGEMAYPEAKLIGEYLAVTKLRGTLAEGGKSWLKSVTKGRLHQRIITLGAVTRRCTHNYIVNIPSNKKPYGKRCRELFTAPPGYKVVGADASGIELRCLAHYLSKWDGGEYAKVVSEGDVHTMHQEVVGLPSRDHAKTFVYAYIYGALNPKLGSIVNKGAKVGKQMRERLESRIPALGKLQAALARRVENRGHLLALDGGRLNIRSAHAVLNTLLQSAGAIICKKAAVILLETTLEEEYEWGTDWWMAAHVHDEVQLLAKEEYAETIGEIAADSFRLAGLALGVKCPLAGEYKVGDNWSETH